jgi:hypothetical protein
MGPRGGARIDRIDRSRLPTHVDDDDLITETAHLDEGTVGKHAHVRPFIAALYGKSTRRGKLKRSPNERACR